MKEFNLTAAEVAKLLKLSGPSVNALVRRSENPLPHFRVGRRILFPTAAVEQWLLDEAARTNAAEHGRSV